MRLLNEIFVLSFLGKLFIEVLALYVIFVRKRFNRMKENLNFLNLVRFCHFLDQQKPCDDSGTQNRNGETVPNNEQSQSSDKIDVRDDTEEETISDDDDNDNDRTSNQPNRPGQCISEDRTNLVRILSFIFKSE